MNSMMMGGAVFVLLGLAGIAVPYFTTQQTHEVAKIGDLKISATEETGHSVPILVSGGAIALGLVLMGAAMMRKT